MDEIIKLTIVTPEKKIFDGEVKDLTSENELGRFEILPHHVKMVTLLTPTVTTFTSGDDRKSKLFTSTGVLRVENNEVSLLCDTAEWPEEIDLSRAEEAKTKAELALKGKDGEDYKKAELKLRRAVARIKAKS